MACFILDVPQRSDAWREARVGFLTSSTAEAMLATISKGEAAGRRNLRTRLVLEWVTRKSQESTYTNGHMDRGTEDEPVIGDRYEAEQGVLLRQVGLLVHPTLKAAGSPDGLVMDGDRIEGVVEFKSRIPAVHLEALQRGIPAKALPQLIHLAWLTDCDWVDYCSYCGDFPEPLQFTRMRLTRADLKGEVEHYGAAIEVFLKEVQWEYEKVVGLQAAAEARRG